MSSGEDGAGTGDAERSRSSGTVLGRVVVIELTLDTGRAMF